MSIPNHLIKEKSPYLLQHLYNPIDWYPWGEEALQKAKNENKPLFISIGYSTCHWCHVMAKESFENEQVAAILNEHFVPIKVDREERQDVDSIYMSACINMNGQGGWPLTIIATPSQKPFFAATYLPTNTKYGRTGLIELLQNVIVEWDSNREKLEKYGEEFSGFLENQNNKQRESAVKGREIFHSTFAEYQKSFDKTFGGFGYEPKFPSPHNLMFLMRYYYFEQDEKALAMVEKTLESMYRGGIFDHIGGGFSRYSTDKMWLVPHFEKMLYDNALLIIAYTEAYQITKKDLYKHIAQTTIEFVIREMTYTSGGFWTALDADTEGEEGLFYLFDYNEIQNVLKEDAKEFCKHFNVTADGNYEGKNVINLIGKDIDKNKKIDDMVQKIYHYRKKRYNLHIDDKILPSMNSLMVMALIKAYKAYDMESYLFLAKKSLDFIGERIIDEDGNIYVSYRDSRSQIMAGLDDYAYYALALTEMYEATFESKYLKKAIFFINKMQENFGDEEGGYFLSDKRADKLIYRPKDVFDGALPSGNSVAGFALNKLAKLTANAKIISLSEKQTSYLENLAGENGSHLSFALMALMQQYYPSKEIIVVARSREETPTLREKQKEFMPETNIIAKFLEGDDPSLYAEYLKEYEMKNNTTTYYICENNTCNMKNKL